MFLCDLFICMLRLKDTFRCFLVCKTSGMLHLNDLAKKEKKAKRDCFQMNPKQNISQAIKLLGN